VTLAAIIIVMGMIVDDAIVVAENITRLIHQGVPESRAVLEGTYNVAFPIIASIITTCVAFIPLYFFTGHFGRFVEFIPPIIFLMLGASLFESLIILPGHMNLPILSMGGEKGQKKIKGEVLGHWFDVVEEKYGKLLERILKRKSWILLLFVMLLASAFYVVKEKMKFVMFPHEETRDLVLTGSTAKGMKRYETAKKVREIEFLFDPYFDEEVVGYRTQIAQSRRGSAVQENRFRMIIEIVPKESRKKSANQLIKEFEEKFEELNGFEKLRFRKSRWGQESGSPIELIVQQNDDVIRKTVVEKLAEEMEKNTALKNVEIEEDFKVPEYRVELNREKIKRLSIRPDDVASTLRAGLEGTVLYEFSNGNEDVHVRFTTVEEAKDDMKKVLAIPVENQGNYLVPLGNIVSVKKVVSPNSISRRDLKRTTLIYADINPEETKTPLNVAEKMEGTIFPEILSQYPTTTLSFGGEVQDTRESKTDFRNAVFLVLFLIFIILAVLFDSLYKPLIIMLAIPFGLVGIILAFYLHGKTLFGFYAGVGALGLAGVVINDSIIMLVKLDHVLKPETNKNISVAQIANVAKTRLRAVFLTTLTTVVGILPTAYGFFGYDSMLAEMMLALTWGMIFGTLITLVLIPSIYSLQQEIKTKFARNS